MHLRFGSRLAVTAVMEESQTHNMEKNHRGGRDTWSLLGDMLVMSKSVEDATTTSFITQQRYAACDPYILIKIIDQGKCRVSGV
jgi:hypothetical protein